MFELVPGLWITSKYLLGWVLCNGLNELDSHKNNDQFSIFFEYKKCFDIISIISKNN